MVMRVRQIAGEFEKLALPKDHSHPDPKMLTAKLEELFQRRTALYGRLAEFYDNLSRTRLPCSSYALAPLARCGS
jgi:hypothetical protein